MDLMQIARLISVIALILLVVAGVVYLAAKTGIPLGKLPGDFVIQRGNFTCLVPLMSTGLISLIITIIINLVIILLKK